ncbi:m127L [Myxoma virus]|uniref:M127L n=1 Tax=Myxoma virus TaxID=10273 RepID=A0A481N7P9_9POXV|nr:m127L [Myxoma virus]QAV36130.1 m127L [Myxoma virus]QAV36637.1 m127L [Myxoma virus]QAV37820.1 m127L [Myxoma virus]
MNVVRSRTLNECEERPTSSVVYWMYREHRIRDNWGLYYAQQKAIRHAVPLYVCVCLTSFHLTTSRHVTFFVRGATRRGGRMCEKVLRVRGTLRTSRSRSTRRS